MHIFEVRIQNANPIPTKSLVSSVGRALHSHCKGPGIEPLIGHIFFYFFSCSELHVVPAYAHAGIFVTLNPAGKEYGGRSRLPDNLKALFRLRWVFFIFVGGVIMCVLLVTDV
jgi:Hydrolytic ATP binding site of dynein motor region